MAVNGLLLALAVVSAGAEEPPSGGGTGGEWKVEVEITQVNGTPARVELVGFENGSYLVRTREGLVAEVEEEKVERIRILRVRRNDGEREGPPEEGPPGFASRPTLLPRNEDERRYARNVRDYLLPTPQRQALFREYKRTGRLEDRKREIMERLPGFTDPANALSMVGDLFAFLYLDGKPKEETARTLQEAALSIRDEDVRGEVVNTLRYFGERWKMLERLKEQGPLRRRPARNGRWTR